MSGEEQSPLLKKTAFPLASVSSKLPPITSHIATTKNNGSNDLAQPKVYSPGSRRTSVIQPDASAMTNSVTATPLPPIPPATNGHVATSSSPAPQRKISTDPPALHEKSMSPSSAPTANAENASLLAANTFLDHCKAGELDVLNGDEKTENGLHAIMNGYEVPKQVISAGGLQSLSFLLDHRDDIVADISTLNLAEFTLFTSAAKTNMNKRKVANHRKEGGKADGERTGAVPVVHARIPAALAARFQPDVHADVEDDWYDVASAIRSEPKSADENASSAASSVANEALTKAVEDMLSEPPSGQHTPHTPSVQSGSILMPTVHRRTRSAEESLNDQKSFVNRVVMRQETYADLQCFRANEYILSFFGDRGYQVDDNRSASSRSTQVSRRSSRNRIAVVHGVDFAERSPRHVPTEEERKAAFFSRDLEELYANVAHAYRVAGIPKGYLDALYVAEVQQGLRPLRLQDARHPGHKKDPVSPAVSDADEPNVLLRSTEVVLADYDIENALQQVLWRNEVENGRDYAPSASRVKKYANKGVSPAQNKPPNDKRVSANNKQESGKKERSACIEKGAEAVADVAKPRRQGRRGSAYKFMLKVLWKNAVHFYYQHNSMSLLTYKFVKTSGNVAIHGRAFRLHVWDNPKTGYLVTGVFDRTAGYPKNFKDPFTNDIYAEELRGGASTTFPVPELMRQHRAVNARCATAEDGITLHGCSIVRQADVYSIYDGRVYGCQVARAGRDHRRTAIHSAVQSLAHYRNLFPKYPSLFRLLHPQDRYRYPVVNPVGGMYCVPLIVNGATRLVKVDDFVPIDPVTGTFRCLTSSANELFPTLLEKALLKANGGGVNETLMECSHVLHQLCGWIPQTIYFLIDGAGNELYWDGMLYASEMWDQLTDMYRCGRMVMSLVCMWESAEVRSASTFARHHPLSRTHDFVTPVSFPVVDVISRVDSTERKVGRPIRAVMLRDTTKDPTDSTFVPPVQTSLSEAVLSSIGYSTIHRESGVFCLTWEEATAYFDHCSVSLNPSMVWSKSGPRRTPKETARLCCHDVYDARLVDLEMFYQPQYHIRCSGVETSTQVFLVYAPHTSSQQPLPWPCDGLSADTVDRCSNGGVQLRLSVFEVTTQPSIVQVARDRAGRPAQTCTFGNCVGHRLTGESETPWQVQSPFMKFASPRNGVPWMKTSLGTVCGYSNAMLSLGFDISPGTREYVVVIETATVAVFRTEERLKDFSYTLTLYSDMEPLEQSNPRCVPYVGGHPVQSTAEEGTSRTHKRKSLLRQFLEKDERQRRLHTPAIAMHPIPSSLNVNSRTVQGMWSKLRSPERSVLLPEEENLSEKIRTGPQYHLHLHRPDEFCIRLCQKGGGTGGRFPTSLKVLLVRKRSNETTALEGSAVEQCDLVLASRNVDAKGAVLNSVSPHTVLLDRTREFVRRPLRVRQEYHAMIYLTAYLTPRSEAKEAAHYLLIRHPNPADTVQWLVVRAFAEGLLISPEACRVSFMGRAIPPHTELRKLFADLRAGYTFAEKNGTWKPVLEEDGEQGLGVDVSNLSLYFDVDVENTSYLTELHFPENELSGRLVARLRHVAWTALLAGAEQCTKTLRALTHLGKLIRQSGLTEDRIAFLLGVARGIASWCSQSAARTAVAASAPPLMLPLLPAGDYVIVTCFVPAGPKEQAKSLKAKLKSVTGDPHMVNFELKVELLRQRVELATIASTVVSPTSEADPQCSFVDEYPPRN